MSEEDKKLLLEMKSNCLEDRGTSRITYNDEKRIKKAKAIDNVLKEIERLNNIIKTKDEGIKAFTEDLCETTEELEKANNIINKMNDYLVMNIANGGLDFMYRQGFKDSYEKLQELKGSDK